jgi:hypothetical protein
VRSLVRTLDDEGRADLARELDAVAHGDDSTSAVAAEPATNDSPDEPPVESHDNRTLIADLLAQFRHQPKGT